MSLLNAIQKNRGKLCPYDLPKQTAFVRPSSVRSVSRFSGRLRADIAQLETKSVGLLALSGVASCAALLCYFGARGAGDSSKVQPLDRLSHIFAMIFLCEHINAQIIAGAALTTDGALVIAFSKTK